MKDVSFDGFAPAGSDLGQAWRDKLEREGKLSEGSLRDLVTGTTSRRNGAPRVGPGADRGAARGRLPRRPRPRHHAARRAARSAGRSCSRARSASARPRSPRRSPSVLDRRLIRLQCYEGIDTKQALYEWDYARQMLQIRALSEHQLTDDGLGRRAVRAEVPARAAAAGRRARRRPGGAARRRGRPRRRRVRGLPARAALRLPDHHPRDRHRSGPSSRRWWSSPPTAPASCTTRSSAAASTTGSASRAAEREVEIVLVRAPGVSEGWPRTVVAAVNRLREMDLAKPPGRRRDHRLGATPSTSSARRTSTHEAVADTLGAVVKDRDDLELVPATWIGSSPVR